VNTVYIVLIGMKSSICDQEKLSLYNKFV
jgi:hypothetical protein